jgi:hypothetical protein
MQREAKYRGYKIRLEPDGEGWRVWIAPIHPDLPILGQSSFRTPLLSEKEAIAEANRWIDETLSH